MPIALTLALVGSRDEPFTEISEEESSRPWDKRAKVDLGIDDDDSLAFVIDRGLQEFGIELPEGHRSGFGHVDVAFYDDTSPRGYSSISGVLTLVDDQGLAVWGVHDYRLVPYSQILRAAEMGILPGDPFRLHLVLREPIGNGVGIDWIGLFQAWEITKEVLTGIGAVGTAAVTLAKARAKVRERLDRGKSVAERDVHRWSQRGATWPRTFQGFLDERPWSSAHLAEVIGCTQEDAEGILGIFGFAPGDDGFWHPSGDEAAKLLRTVFDEALWGDVGLSEEYEAKFRQRVQALLEYGEMPPRPEFGETYEDELGEDEDYCSFCGQARPRAYLAYGSLATICGDCVAGAVLGLTQSNRGAPLMPREAESEEE